MDAAPLLSLVGRLRTRHRLDAVVIGNAAAALQGSPVTTVDIDFMFRKTPTNLRKLTAIAAARLHGKGGRDSLVRGAARARHPGHLRRAHLPGGVARDVIRSKERAGREQDLTVLSILRRTLDEAENR